MIEVLGDRPINDYASSEAGKLRDALLDRGLAVTAIKRMFGSVKAIINLAMAEHGVEGLNAKSASNALNKWLHANFQYYIVISGFRHTKRDRLRPVSTRKL